jgi:hypothetical protein
MPDISMCSNGETCDLRSSCYRYLAEPSRFQSYMASPNPGSDCEYYWSYGPVDERKTNS